MRRYRSHIEHGVTGFEHSSRAEGGFWCRWRRTRPTRRTSNRGPGHRATQKRLRSAPTAEAQSCSAVESLSIKEQVLKGKDRTREEREGPRRDSGGGGYALNAVLIKMASCTGALELQPLPLQGIYLARDCRSRDEILVISSACPPAPPSASSSPQATAGSSL